MKKYLVTGLILIALQGCSNQGRTVRGPGVGTRLSPIITSGLAPGSRFRLAAYIALQGNACQPIITPGDPRFGQFTQLQNQSMSSVSGSFLGSRGVLQVVRLDDSERRILNGYDYVVPNDQISSGTRMSTYFPAKGFSGVTNRNRLIFSPDLQEVVVTLEATGQLLFYPFQETGATDRPYIKEGFDHPTEIAASYTPWGQYYVVATGESGLAIGLFNRYNAINGRSAPATPVKNIGANRRITSLWFSPDGTVLFVGSSGVRTLGQNSSSRVDAYDFGQLSGNVPNSPKETFDCGPLMAGCIRPVSGLLPGDAFRIIGNRRILAALTPVGPYPLFNPGIGGMDPRSALADARFEGRGSLFQTGTNRFNFQLASLKAIGINPANDDVLVLAGTDVLQFPNDAMAWSQQGRTGNGLPLKMGLDPVAFAVDADTPTIVVADQGGQKLSVGQLSGLGISYNGDPNTNQIGADDMRTIGCPIDVAIRTGEVGDYTKPKS